MYQPNRRSEPALNVSLARRRHESPVWTSLAAAGLLGAVLLAVIGVPTVDMHGPLHYAGIMDPLCGATRSVYLTMHGELASALRYNPAAPLLLAVAVGLVLRALAGWSTRRWLTVHVTRRILVPLAVVAVVALEVNQQLNAALLIQPWTGG